jgi:hypothetical protein
MFLFIKAQATINANEAKNDRNVTEFIKQRKNMKGVARKIPLIPTLKAPPIQNNIDIAEPTFLNVNFILFNASIVKVTNHGSHKIRTDQINPS